MVSPHEEEPNGRQKKQRGAEAPHLLEPQKAHLTGEFVKMAVRCFVWVLGLQLWSSSE